MAAFELKNASNDNRAEQFPLESEGNGEACIIALKVYDCCRQQDCLTYAELGPALSAVTDTVCGEGQTEGEPVIPPSDADSVLIDRLRVKKITVVDKEPIEFKKGYWDIKIKYEFEYRLTFRDDECKFICRITAKNYFTKDVILFGSEGSDIAVGTDLLSGLGGVLDEAPFVSVVAKAMALRAKLITRDLGRINGHDLTRTVTAVEVTIGLFSIVRLFRIVNLKVQTSGVCIPDECNNELNPPTPIDPCEVFNNLEFPMDVFNPPLRDDFFAGVSNNISRGAKECKECGGGQDRVEYNGRDIEHDVKDEKVDNDRGWRGRDRY